MITRWYANKKSKPDFIHSDVKQPNFNPDITYMTITLQNLLKGLYHAKSFFFELLNVL